MEQLIGFITDYPYITVIGITCIIQITPIQINPWTMLFSWIGKQVNTDLKQELNELEKKINELEDKVDHLNKDVSDERVQSKRWSILDFTNSCRQGHLHTKEEWDHCLDQLKWYEEYCEDNNIPNGVIEEGALWLRARYSTHLDKDDFLKD